MIWLATTEQDISSDLILPFSTSKIIVFTSCNVATITIKSELSELSELLYSCLRGEPGGTLHKVHLGLLVS